MNTTELPVRPDVSAFVARVRELLADLSEEDRLELTEGLEADLTDQVAEQGGGVLADPEAYARSSRAGARTSSSGGTSSSRTRGWPPPGRSSRRCDRRGGRCADGRQRSSSPGSCRAGTTTG